MASSTAPLRDIEEVKIISDQLGRIDGDGVVITSIDYAGRVQYYTDSIKVVAWIPWASYPRNIAEALAYAKSTNMPRIYLVWYSDGDARELGFVKLYRSGNMKLYEYSLG